MFVIEDSESPPFEEIQAVLSWLSHIKYSTADLHNEIAQKMTLIATKHFDRASKLCSIESIKGKKSPEQLALINNVVKTFNDDK